MIKHLFKLVWNRKRSNLLIIAEILGCFLVLFAVVVMAVYNIDHYRKPLGFDYENVWSVSVSLQTMANIHLGETEGTMKTYFQALKDLDEVEAVAGIGNSPYTASWSNNDFEYRGKNVEAVYNRATDDLKEVLRLQVIEGRWFDASDDGQNWQPVVINQKLKEVLFGDEDPIGRDVAAEQDRQAGRSLRVVGVITDFRKGGEFSAPGNYAFRRVTPSYRDFYEFLIRVRPGTRTAFEEKLVKHLHAVNPNWSFEVEPLSQMRDRQSQLRTAPLIAGVVVAVFLIVMVGLGLVGVVWQNVSQRTTEIGLRRALGAARGRIYQQVLGELLVITSAGLLPGLALVVQLPLLDLVGFLSARVYICSLLVSVAMIYILTILCGLYPSRMATRIQPVEALRWE